MTERSRGHAKFLGTVSVNCWLPIPAVSTFNCQVITISRLLTVPPTRLTTTESTRTRGSHLVIASTMSRTRAGRATVIGASSSRHRLQAKVGRSGSLPGGVDISAYRIVQEGLTNALKHAHATEAEVSLHYAPDQLSIEVQDNGHGMALGNGHSPGHGLIGIRERVRLYDGEMTTGTPAGGGFLLRVRMPLTRQPL